MTTEKRNLMLIYGELKHMETVASTLDCKLYTLENDDLEFLADMNFALKGMIDNMLAEHRINRMKYVWLTQRRRCIYRTYKNVCKNHKMTKRKTIF